MGNGDKRTVGYIEERGAKVGKQVELVDVDGEFWDVLSVGYSMSKEAFQRQNRTYKIFQISTKGGGID
jgi:hypothetical protein